MSTLPAPGRTRMGNKRLIRRCDRATPVAHENGLAPSQGKYGNEKETHVVINALQTGLRQSTMGTKPRGIVQGDRLRLNAADEQKHGPPLFHIFP